MSAFNFDIADRLARAWDKTQTGLKQETAGRALWVEGTMELVQVLDEARKEHPSDQEFGGWLSSKGYGEDRISSQDRAALLNMALNLDLTREILKQTIRRSWRLIWEEEIQPRLPSAGQPANDGQPASNNDTRRPKG
jgi:hypothetical protein